MPASGSSLFSDADGYGASLQDMLDLLVLRPRDFHARLTWVELPSLRLLRAQEASARIAYVTLAPELMFVTFLTKRGAPLISGGIDLQFGELMVHSCGDRLHQRTTAACEWGSICLTPASLATFGRVIADKTLLPPKVRQVLRPIPSHRQQLLRLHAQAGRIAETNLNSMGNKEIVRALEQDMICALITCLTTAKWQDICPIDDERSRLLVRLETLLAEQPFRLWRIADIARAIGVSEHILGVSCSRHLGMSLYRYQRLRRLTLMRAELLDTRRAPTNNTELIGRYGFTSLHRFVTEYWDEFGEMPPIPPSGYAE
jgi:AraC-like DNA-binding protein